MSGEFDRSGPRYANVLPVLRYFYAIAWERDRLYFALVAATTAIRGTSPFINILFPKFLIDELMGPKRPDVVARLVTALVLANLVVYLLNNALGLAMNRSRTRIEMGFDELLAEKTMYMDFEYTENAQVLTNLERARTGMSWYSGGIGGLSENLTSIVSAFITLAGTVYIMSRLSAWLMVALVVTIVLNMVIVSQAQKMQAQFMKDLVAINRKFQYYFGLVKNFRFGKDIRMYTADTMVAKRVDEYVDQDWAVEMRRTEKANRYEWARVLITAGQQTLLYGYLGLRVLSHAIGIGDFQMLIGAALGFSGSLSGLLSQFIDIAKNADFMNEYRLFMQYPAAKDTGVKRITPGGNHVFEFRNVSFKYPGAQTYALRNVSLTIPAGQKLSMVGENGAGKTTFVKLLCRLYDPTEGEILLDGVNVKEYLAADYTRFFSVVFQDFRLLAFTVGENIAVGETIDEARLALAAAEAGFDERLATLEAGAQTSVYKTFDEKGVEFSGGEGQKLAIARAVYKDAPVVVLDEPTAALDPVAEYEIYNRFNELVGGKTTVYISHRLSSCRFCDRIAVFVKGSIAECGAHDELVRQGGKYTEMWSAQAKYYQTDGGMEAAG